MAKQQLKIELHPVQAAFIHSPAPFRGFVGGRGAGKSFVGSYDLLRRAKPGRLYMIVAPTYKVLKDASFRSFIDHARKLNFVKDVNKADLRVVLGNGAEVLCRSAENPDSLRGPNLSGCWMDEASYCHEDAYQIVIACLREAGEQGWLSATFTPKGKSHWTYKQFALRSERGEKEYQLFQAKTKDNPFLPPGFDNILRGQYTSQMARQELEGTFLDLGGKIFNRAWFRQTLKFAPAKARRVRYWDKAATEDGGCYTCGVLMAADYEGRYYVEDVVRGQWSTFTRDDIILQTARMDAMKYHHQVRIVVEQEPGSGGLDSLRGTIRMLAGHHITGHKPSKDKRVRAEPFAAQAEAGNVVLIEGRWNQEFLDELEDFPEGLADQVDASSGAFNKLIEGNTSVPCTGAGPGGGAGGASAALPGGQQQIPSQGGFPGMPGMPGMAGRGGLPNLPPGLFSGSGGGSQGVPGLSGMAARLPSGPPGLFGGGGANQFNPNRNSQFDSDLFGGREQLGGREIQEVPLPTEVEE